MSAISIMTETETWFQSMSRFYASHLPLAVLMSTVEISPVSCAPPGQQAARQALLRQHNVHCRALTLQQRLTYLSSI